MTTLFFRRSDNKVYRSRLESKHVKATLKGTTFPYLEIRPAWFNPHEYETPDLAGKRIEIYWETETGESFGIAEEQP